ncbi:TetR/AcrR family transcriptional regulator, partial [Mycobacterium sp. ITM-2017-0098]
TDRRDPADVRAAMAAIIGAYRRHQPVLVALNEMAPYDAAVGDTYRELLAEVSDGFKAVIVEGQQAGAIRPQLPPETTANALVLMVERTCQQNLPSKPVSFDAELADVLTEIVWGALYLAPR